MNSVCSSKNRRTNKPINLERKLALKITKQLISSSYLEISVDDFQLTVKEIAGPVTIFFEAIICTSLKKTRLKMLSFE